MPAAIETAGRSTSMTAALVGSGPSPPSGPTERFRRRWLPTLQWGPYADSRADEQDLAGHLRALPTDPRQVTGQLRRLAVSGVAEVERDRGRRGTQQSGTDETEGEPAVTRRPPGFQRQGRCSLIQKRGRPPSTPAVFPSWAVPLCMALIPLSGASGCYRAVAEAASPAGNEIVDIPWAYGFLSGFAPPGCRGAGSQVSERSRPGRDPALGPRSRGRSQHARDPCAAAHHRNMRRYECRPIFRRLRTWPMRGPGCRPATRSYPRSESGTPTGPNGDRRSSGRAEFRGGTLPRKVRTGTAVTSA